jgi:acyl carrier protein
MHKRADSADEFVIATIAEFACCGQGEVARETSLVDLGVDSLWIATLTTFVEAEYDCTFTPTQLMSLYAAARVDDLLLAVRQVVGGGADSEVNQPSAALLI